MKDVAGWFNGLVPEKAAPPTDDAVLIAIGSAADEGGDTSMRHDEDYEDFERRRFRAMGAAVVAALEALGLDLKRDDEGPHGFHQVDGLDAVRWHVTRFETALDILGDRDVITRAELTRARDQMVEGLRRLEGRKV